MVSVVYKDLNREQQNAEQLKEQFCLEQSYQIS